jgi:hypothetical protein
MSDPVDGSPANPRIFDSPLAPDEALGYVTALLALPHVRTLAEQKGFLDAQPRDRDFRKFEFFDVRDPFMP